MNNLYTFNGYGVLEFFFMKYLGTVESIRTNNGKKLENFDQFSSNYIFYHGLQIWFGLNCYLKYTHIYLSS